MTKDTPKFYSSFLNYFFCVHNAYTVLHSSFLWRFWALYSSFGTELAGGVAKVFRGKHILYPGAGTE